MLTVSPGITLRSMPRRILTSPAALPSVSSTPESETMGFPGADFGIGPSDMASIVVSQRKGDRLALGAYGPQRGRFNAALLGMLLATLAAFSAGAAENRETVILALGDSLTAGYRIAGRDSFPSRLEAALRAKGMNARVVNGGVSGDTSAGGLRRLDWLMAEQPALVIVELGANDGLRGIDPAVTRRNLDRIVAEAKGRGVRVLLTGMLAPPNLGREFGDAFNAVFPAVAEKHKVPLYPFFLDGVAGKPALNLPDGIHPNPAGVTVIVERILPYVLRALGVRS
jgi:acyl-CoA thioesterase-1